METMPPRDPLARERARRKRAEQIQRRRIVLAVCLLGLIIVIVVVAVAASGDEGSASITTTSEPTATSLQAATYTADLTGSGSVPSVKTQATGSLTLTYDPETETFVYVLDINGLTNPSVAAIYEGAPGTNGTVVLPLFEGPTEEGLFSGVLVRGTVEDTSLTGSLTGETVGDLIALIQAGGAYVSVGNTSHPVDAIRGQIE